MNSTVRADRQLGRLRASCVTQSPKGAKFLLVATLLAFSLLGCESKLPGPIECESMVFRSIGASAESLARQPRLQRFADSLVQACLTTPFDRKMMRCVEENRGIEICLGDFLRRRPDKKPQIERLLVR